MPSRKARVRVVLDTNVIIAFHLSTNPQSVNTRVYQLWRNQRKLQLVVSDDTVAEYLEVLQRLGVSEHRIKRLEERLKRRETVTHIRLGARPRASRDPDDNVVLATAMTGRVKFLVTNDRDLLELSAVDRRKFKFAIVTPNQLLMQLDE